MWSVGCEYKMQDALWGIKLLIRIPCILILELIYLFIFGGGGVNHTRVYDTENDNKILVPGRVTKCTVISNRDYLLTKKVQRKILYGRECGGVNNFFFYLTAKGDTAESYYSTYLKMADWRSMRCIWFSI